MSNKLSMIMIVARIRIMKNKTDETTMREEANEDDSGSVLFTVPAVLVPVLVGNIVLSPAVFIHVVVGKCCMYLHLMSWVVVFDSGCYLVNR